MILEWFGKILFFRNEVGMQDNTLAIGSYTFPITKATFRYVSDNGQGRAGWEFDISTKCIESLDASDLLYGKEPRLYCERGDPIPLTNSSDLTGKELFLKEPYEPKSGDVYFTFYVFEHGNLTDLKMKFLRKRGNEYQISVLATIPEGEIFSHPERLRIQTWIEQLPDKTYGGAL